jgi:hypothetical protein
MAAVLGLQNSGQQGSLVPIFTSSFPGFRVFLLYNLQNKNI